MVRVLDEDIKKKLVDFYAENFPMVTDLEFELTDDELIVFSSTSLEESKPSVEQFNYVETLLDATFITVISQNGRYGGIFKFNK